MLTLNQLAVHHALIRAPQAILARQAALAALVLTSRLREHFGDDLNNTEQPLTLSVFEVNSGPSSLAAAFKEKMSKLVPNITVQYDTLIPTLLTPDGEWRELEEIEKALAARFDDFEPNLDASEDERKAAVTEKYHDVLNCPFEQPIVMPAEGSVHAVLIPDLAFGGATNGVKTLLGLYGALEKALDPTIGRILQFPALPLTAGRADDLAKQMISTFADGRSLPDYYVSWLNRNFIVSPNSSGLIVFDEDENIQTYASGSVGATFNMETGYLHLNYIGVRADVIESDKKGKTSVRDTTAFDPFEAKVLLPPISLIPLLLHTFDTGSRLRLRGTHNYDPSASIKKDRSNVHFQPVPLLSSVPALARSFVGVQEYQFEGATALSVILPSEAAALVAEREAEILAAQAANQPKAAEAPATAKESDEEE